MSLRVHVPIRLHWRSAADPLDGGAAVALDRAQQGLDRALARCADHITRHVLEPRRGHARLRGTAPRFTWTDPARRVPQASRRALEGRVTASIEAVLRRLECAEEAPRSATAAAAREFVDTLRLQGGRYRVHSYDGAPDEVDVAVQAAHDPVTGTGRDDGYEVVFWFWDGSDQALVSKLLELADERQLGPHARTMGIVCRGQRDGLTGIFAVTAELRRTGGALEILRYQYAYIADRFRVIGADGPEPRQESAEGLYRLERLSDYAGAEALRSKAMSALLALEGLPTEPLPSDTPPMQRRRQVITAAVDVFVNDFGDSTDRTFARLTTPLGTRYFLTPMRTMFAQRDTIDLIGASALARVHPGTGDGTSEGGPGPGAGADGDAGAEAGDDFGAAADGADGSGGSPLPTSEGPADPRARQRLFPRVSIGGETLDLDLSSFLDEPHVDDLGPPGRELKRLIQRIAYRLEMPEGGYTGAFLIAAARVIGARAALAGQAAVAMPRATEVVASGSGNLGDLQVTPEHTPAVLLLRHVAATCPLVSGLTRTMSATYELPEVHRHWFGRYQGRPAGWLLHFHRAHTPVMEVSVANLFMRACQSVMLQVLRGSRAAIEQRLINFDGYFEVFSTLITGLVAEEAELHELRDTLIDIQRMFAPSVQSTVSAAYRTWREARQALSTRLSDQLLTVSEALDGPDLRQGTPHRRADGVFVVRDRRGRDWTLADLEAAIAMRHGLATSIDPLIQQLANVPDVVDVFRHRPWLARSYLRTLLEEMRGNNDRITHEVSDSVIYAFRSGRIRENLQQRTVPGTSVALQGIHQLAHEAVGDAFVGDPWYAAGLNLLFGVEQGREALLSFLEFGLVMSVSILCPPAGAALGVVIAQVHVAQAEERLSIYRAVMDPEVLYQHAELEMDLFMAELEMVLSILPEVGSLGRGVSKASATIGRRGLRAGARRLAREARVALLRSVADQVRQGLARAFVEALVVDRVMTLVLPHLIGPIMQAVEAEVRGATVTQPTPSPGAGTSPPEEPTGPTADEESPSSPEGVAFAAGLDEYTPSAAEERRSPAEEQP